MTAAAHIEKTKSALMMAKHWGRNVSEQQLVTKNILQQVVIKKYIYTHTYSYREKIQC